MPLTDTGIKIYNHSFLVVQYVSELSCMELGTRLEKDLKHYKYILYILS